MLREMGGGGGGLRVRDVIGRGQADDGAFLRSLGRELQPAGGGVCLRSSLSI